MSQCWARPSKGMGRVLTRQDGEDSARPRDAGVCRNVEYLESSRSTTPRDRHLIRPAIAAGGESLRSADDGPASKRNQRVQYRVDARTRAAAGVLKWARCGRIVPTDRSLDGRVPPRWYSDPRRRWPAVRDRLDERTLRSARRVRPRADHRTSRHAPGFASEDDLYASSHLFAVYAGGWKPPVTNTSILSRAAGGGDARI